ncbi:hypothetical protein [Proteus genomosp. 6]|uniref:hypothetical protein n=1 Tax=Proteus genomosp. 6 TaxID=1311820 RepID=UPI000D69E9E6|nr:hypothetical protein [Proteus genomosp. 6]
MKNVLIIKSDSTTEIKSVDDKDTTVQITDISLVPKDIRERPIEYFPYNGKYYPIARDCDLISDDRVRCVIAGIN